MNKTVAVCSAGIPKALGSSFVLHETLLSMPNMSSKFCRFSMGSSAANRRKSAVISDRKAVRL